MYEVVIVFMLGSCLDSLLVGRGRAVVLGLVHLVGSSSHSSGKSVGDGVVTWDVTLGLLLVSLLLGLSGRSLDGLRDVVGGVLQWSVDAHRSN